MTSFFCIPIATLSFEGVELSLCFFEFTTLFSNFGLHTLLIILYYFQIISSTDDACFKHSHCSSMCVLSLC